ncbi:MAG: hypothetical protein ABR968_15000, partial [Bacteroidales bacterium]
SLDNLLADSLLQVNPDTSLKIVYNNTLYNVSVDSLVNIPSTISKQSFGSPFSADSIHPGSLLFSQTSHNTLALGNAQITKIIIRSGYLDLIIKNTLQGKIQCTYQIPCATNILGLFSITRLVPAGTIASPSVYTEQIPVEGYSLNLTGPSGSSYNTITSTINAITDPHGGYDNILLHDSITVSASFEGLVLDYAKGYFGSESFKSGKKDSPFSLFKKITAGTLTLQSMQLTLNITNGFGIDANLLIKEIKSINNRTGNVVSLISPIIGNTINITRAYESGNSTNPVIPSTYSFNLNSSNFLQLIENLPDSLEYSLNMTTNPLGNVSSGNDFIYNKYGFNATLDLEIPLSLVANNLTLTDTIGFNLSKPNGYTINRGVLTLIADNGFPFSAGTQLFLLNANKVKTDSLIVSNNIISAPMLDANYKVISPLRSIIKIPLSGAKLNDLFNAKKMIIVARFNTAAQPNFIKIYNNYKLGMEVTGDFNMTVN